MPEPTPLVPGEPGRTVVALPPRPAPHVPALDAAGLRLVLRALLFDGASVPAWHDEAACATRPRSLFFVDAAHGRTRAATVRAAKAVCHGCPVRVTCLADVMAHESPSHRYGVVAGLSPAERHGLHRSTLGMSS